jgi:hypothetical protein
MFTRAILLTHKITRVNQPSTHTYVYIDKYLHQYHYTNQENI